MWIIQPEKTDEMRKRESEDLANRMRESQDKADAQRKFIENTTCPHCKRHDPLPPWLL